MTFWFLIVLFSPTGPAQGLAQFTTQAQCEAFRATLAPIVLNGVTLETRCVR